MTGAVLVEIRDLACVAGYRPLFSKLCLQLGAGQWVELTGPNGTGKTTLLRTLAGLSRPVAGQLTWQGEPIAATSALWRALLVYQGHAPALKDTLTSAENLAAWLALDHGKRPDKDQTIAWLQTAGIAACADLPAASLSAGQRRRVQLARLAAAVERPVWLLDEPANALDTDGLALLNRLLGEHLERGGMAIVATHQSLAPGPAARPLFMPDFAYQTGQPA